MTREKLTKALAKLSASRIGLREAAVLFASVGGATSSQLAVRTGHPLGLTRSRVQTIRDKRLLAVSYQLDGTAIYSPSPSGMKLINATIRESV